MSIELRGVRKSFDGKEILRDVSFEVREGETLAIIGYSGAGKSLTLKHVVGLVRPDGGEVRVDGVRVAELERAELHRLRREVGYVFQFAALFDSMTVAENVGMGLRRIPGLGEGEIRERVEESLDLVDLRGFGGEYPAELSGGQQKRVGLARAIATRPKYLLYDEPTSGLDPVTTTVIDRLILRMREELGVTAVAVTHNIVSAYRIADRIAMLYEGRIRLEGRPEEVRSTEDPVVRGFVEGKPELAGEAG